MSSPLRYGIPALPGPLAPTALAAPDPDTRVTILPMLPLVPVRSLLARALTEDSTVRDIVWVDLPVAPTDDAEAWEAIRTSFAAASGRKLTGADPESSVVTFVAGLQRPLLLALQFEPAVS